MESRAARLQTALTAALLVSAVLLGGGQGWLGDTFCQLLALAAIALAAWRHLRDPTARWPRVAWLAALVLLVPALQLLPIPESIWTWSEARRALQPGLESAGVDAPMRLTLQPLATERAMWWVLPASAMFLGVLQLDQRHRGMLLGLLLGLTLLSVVLGLAQLAGGTDSGLRFYRITNSREAVGFFANRNHFASLLACMLPVVIVGVALWYRRHEGNTARTVLGVAAGTGMIVLLILGLALTRSRAGLVLGMIAVLMSLPIALKLRDRRGGLRRILVAAVAVGLVLVANFALLGILQRLEKDPMDDGRLRLAEVAKDVAASHRPFGAGLGGFRAAYEAGEPLPEGPSYVNHAHNDYLETWVEAGWLAVPLAVLFAAAFVAAGFAAWRPFVGAPGGGREAAAMRAAAWIALLLLALHSLVDYPLRTTTMLAVAGLLAAVSVRIPSNRSME